MASSARRCNSKASSSAEEGSSLGSGCGSSMIGIVDLTVTVSNQSINQSINSGRDFVSVQADRVTRLSENAVCFERNFDRCVFSRPPAVVGIT
mmetsp:Transcript_18949/g.43976  ORF Transcript_18949/g.43976 Transcript_18949/m.43976 type:complete len:93 (+) Transcript_18949:2063-2341(+)